MARSKTRRKLNKKQTKMKITKNQEDELYRELNTMERDDLIELVVNYMSDTEKIDFIEQWKQN